MRPKKRWKEPSTNSKDSTSEPKSNRGFTDQELFAFALKKLDLRPYPTSELRKKLLNASGDKALVDTIIQRLTACGYIDDRRYVELYVQSNRSRKHHSRFRIERELRAKGLDPALIDHVLEEVYPPADDSAQLVSALGKKLKTLSLPMDAKKLGRLYNYLVRRGFQEEAIHRELTRRFKNQIQSEP
ncbi:MAG: hypothetical protein DMG05_26410 [Acidobacteria bacterium]|nr:MAG: hypothetical protein DMG05_26410 [Acidobacteriota bacterium]